jgi:hypothetical protein
MAAFPKAAIHALRRAHYFAVLEQAGRYVQAVELIAAIDRACELQALAKHLRGAALRGRAVDDLVCLSVSLPRRCVRCTYRTRRASRHRRSRTISHYNAPNDAAHFSDTRVERSAVV